MNATGFSTTDVPTLGASGRRKKYRASDKGRQTRNGQEQRKRERDYMSRPFIAWDGEGMTVDRHLYTMLAHSRGGIIRNVNGLDTVTCLEFMLNSDTSDGINVIYGGNYDINMILTDLPKHKLETLYHTGKVWYGDYRIEWRPGKQFSVRQGERRFRLYDVLPFFQATFVKACDEYLGTDWEHRDAIIAGKKARGTFTETDQDDVEEYNAAELRVLIDLTTELRERLYRVGIRITRWDGPGAIATSLFQKYETKGHIRVSPESVKEAVRYGYAGGRFEIIRQGHSERECFQYDINSAYPHAFQHLPCLAHGRWEHRDGPTRVADYGIYRIDTRAGIRVADWTRPQPLWYRTRDGRVIFGTETHNWFWSPEARLQPDAIIEGWEWIPECDHRPFAFVPALYNKRKALKKAGDGAHVGLKLGLNSLYGKTAQQVGWIYDHRGLRIPPYHCLEWAGYVTSYCRAMLYMASLQAPDDIIAFETDALFTRVPLDLPVSDKLGEWEETRYKSLTYLMSGYYFGTKIDGEEVEKSRGVNKGSVARQQLIDAINTFGNIEAEQTRFITLGQALHQTWDDWQQWKTSPRILSARIEGKRIHAMTNEYGSHGKDDGWLETWPNPLMPMENGMSKQYDIEWEQNTDYDRSHTRRINEDISHDVH